MEIKPENYFFLKDGTVIKSLFELSKALDKMPEDVFRYHVNVQKNDFSNWVRDIIMDKELAEKMRSATGKAQIQKLIGEGIQKKVVEEMNKRKTNIQKPKATAKKIIPRQKQVEEDAKKQNETRGTVGQQDINKAKDEFKKRLPELFVKKEAKPAHKYQEINPYKTNYGIKCPYKTIHCGILEFAFGIVVGLLAAFVLMAIL